MKRKASVPVAAKGPKKAKVGGDYQLGREMPRQPRAELKAFDLAQTTSTFTNAAITLNLLNIVAVGTEFYNRIGRKMYMKSVHIRGFVKNTATAVQDVGRIIVFYDSNPNGAAPVLADILQDANGAAASTATSEINLNNRARFKIIRDHQIIFPSVTFNAGVLTNQAFQETDNQMNIDMFIKLKGLETMFNAGAAGTIADITTGALFVGFIANNNNGLWSCTFGSRLRYYD